MEFLLQQVRIVDPVSQTDRVADISITDGKIEAVGTDLTPRSSQTNVMKALGLVLGPGLVDLYSHSGEPGQEARETLATLAAAATAGGFTRVALLPDTVPPADNPAVLKALAQKYQELKDLEAGTDRTYLHFWAALSLGTEGQQMAELAELATGEAVGFTDGRPLGNLALLRGILEYLHPLNKPIALFPRIGELRGNGVMREGGLSLLYGLPGDPEISEAAALAALLEVVAATATPVHLMRISTRRGVELIAESKARGLPVTASTSWMHLLLDTRDLASYDPNLRLDPPLGNEGDRRALIEGVREGIIDAIAVDHTPHTYEEKTVAFAEAPPGAIGLELALPLLWQQLVASGQWSAIELWRSLSLNPRLCLQQKPVGCQPGERAELVLFDPEATWTVEAAALNSLSANTPWWGQAVKGRAVRIWNSH